MKKGSMLVKISCFVLAASTFVGLSKNSFQTIKAVDYPSYSKVVYETNMVKPFWKSNIIYNEICMPISRWEDGEMGWGMCCAFLKFKPIQIISVRDHTLKTEYTPGTDYIVDKDNNMLKFPSGSRIGARAIDGRALYTNAYTDTCVQQVNQAFGSNYTKGNSPAGGHYQDLYGVTYNEELLFKQTYLEVTYVYDTSVLPSDPNSNMYPFSSFDSNIFKQLRGKLEDPNRKEINILSIGDSISSGNNASGGLSGLTNPWGEPYQPPYQQLIANEITRLYGKKVNIEYASSGGTSSSWPLSHTLDAMGRYGDEVFNAAKNKYNYDLTIIAYGMNDAGANVSQNDYTTNILNIVLAMCQTKSTTCDYLLVSSFARNPIASSNLSNIYGVDIDDLLAKNYLSALNYIKNNYSTQGLGNIQVLDMHKLSDYYIGNNDFSGEIFKKKYAEISASNMNHPNDFFHRLYASNIMNIIHPYGNSSYADDFATYTVSFNSNGGSSVSSQTCYAGEKISQPANPSKTGYTFGGWFTDSGCSQQYDFTKAVNSSFTLYAKWTAKTATITLNGNGATSSGTTSINTTYGVTLPNITIPSRTGYKFLGYFENQDGTGTQYYSDNGSSSYVSNFTSAKTIYAKWQINQYKLTWDANGGSLSGTYTSGSVNYGATITAPTATKTGYTFTGWDKNVPATMPNNDLTITATWKINVYTVSFNSNGGSDVPSTTVEHGSLLSKPNDPTKEDFLFDGWYSDSNLTKPYNFDTPVTGILFLFAKWKNTPLRDFTLYFMHPEIPTTNIDDTGKCRGEYGYYALAKEAFNVLSEAERIEFLTSIKYEPYKHRLLAWANANGDLIVDNSLKPFSSINPLFDCSNECKVILGLISATVLSFCIYLMIHKKRKNKSIYR